MNFSTHAIHYATAGWLVFPCHTVRDGSCSCGRKNCRSVGKHPRTKHGLKDAAADEEKVRAMFVKPANIGIATGSASGIVVLDVDPRHGGQETLAKLEERYCKLPKTVEAMTGGGGIHLYFRYPTSRPIPSKNGWRPGIDVKSEGGYVIAPPSNHVSGQAYQWRPGQGPGQIESADLPTWLLDELSARTSENHRLPPGSTSGKSDLLEQRAWQYAAQTPPVEEGNRNQTAFELAGHLASFSTDDGARLNESQLLACLSEWNSRNTPPLEDDELRQCLVNARKNGTPRTTKVVRDVAGRSESKECAEVDSSERPSQATLLTDLAGNVELFHDDDREPFARFPVGDGANRHWEIANVRSRHFKTWLSRRFYLQSGRAPSSQAMQDALCIIEAKAVFEGEPREVHIRVAGRNGMIYLDLCNERWQVVEIDAVGWRILDDSQVMFRRPKSMQSLVIPDATGSLDDLRPFANVTDEDWPLLLSFLIGAMSPTGPYPVLAVYGEHGSAKSSLCRLIRKLVDPNRSPLRADHRVPHDLMIGANNGWVLALDNLSSIPLWLSDCLCRLSTGGGFSTRKLYENDEEVIFDAKRPVILNCIEDAVVRADLLDRCLVLNLPRIDPGRRISERQLERDFERELPRILGGLLNAISTAIRNFSHVRLSSHPRMADFAIWVAAAEPALGLDSGEFMAAYERNRSDGNETAIEASPVGQALVELVDIDGHWSGTATELLVRMEYDIDEKTKHLKSWPTTARALSGTVKRLAPNLRDLGIGVEFRRKGHKGARTIELFRTPDEKVDSSSATSADVGHQRGSEILLDADDCTDDESTRKLNYFSRSSARCAMLDEPFRWKANADDADHEQFTSSRGDGWGEV